MDSEFNDRSYSETPPPMPGEVPPFHRTPPPPPFSDSVKEDPRVSDNPMGLVGFILSLVSFLGFTIPVGGLIGWILGLVFSCIGLTKRPRGFAIAGLVISLTGLVILVIALGFLAIILADASN